MGCLPPINYGCVWLQPAHTVPYLHCLLHAHLAEALPCHTGSKVGDQDTAQALWSYDTQQHRWQQRRATGVLPEPRRTVGLAVANGKAYLLSDHEIADWNNTLQVYELDLESWHGRLLPDDAQAPTCWVRGCPAIIEASV